MIKNNAIDCIGDTPLVKLDNIKKEFNLPFNIYAKLERCNPSGSIKDRAAKQIILDALKENKINKDTMLLEATSGNTGISLSMIAASLGLKLTIVMLESCSIERIKMMRALGANVVLTPGKLGMKGTLDKVEELKKEYPNSFVCDQFNNLSNSKAHYLTTANEILKDLDNKVDVFISAFGTSGTLIGTSKRLKEVLDKVEVIGVEPSSSPLVTEGKASSHKIQGIGANFIPSIYEPSLVDKVMTITDEESYLGTRLLAKKEGLLCGISSGASLMAAIKLDKELYKDKNVVIVLPDNGERYLSVDGLFE